MFEDSISCSPGNEKKSSRSRSRRFHKNTRRKSQKLSSTPATHELPTEETPCLDALYEECTPTTTRYERFNPFENEIILAAADMSIEPATSTSKLNALASQGFVRLEHLPLSSDEDHFLSPERANQHQPNVNVICGPETQFGITESEFVRFCDEVEIDVDSQPVVETKTPKCTKSIVDAILEDFCSSPYSESPPKFLVDDDIPVFRFKSNSLRTYAGIRRKKPRRNIDNELANTLTPDDDGNASDSSGLSVQEDFSQTVVPPLDTVDLNNSIRVCENLLNLSSYFSQVTSHEKSSSSFTGEKEESPLFAIVEDIIKLKQKPFTICRSKSLEEFHGFSDGDSDSKEDTLKDLLEDEDDVLQQINCDSLCYEQIVPKVSFEYNCNDLDSALDDVNAVIEEANKLISSRSELNLLKDTLPKSLEKSAFNDEQLFDDNDFWNDNECLLNYKTQKTHSNPCKPQGELLFIESPSPHIDPIKDEPVTSKMPSNIETSYEFFDKGKTTDCRSIKSKAENAVKYPLESPISTSTFVGFSTASMKPIAISEEAKRKADGIFAKFEQEETEQRMSEVAFERKSCDDISKTRIEATNVFTDSCVLNLDQRSFPSFVGFSTASSKPIAIFEEAKRKADAILAKFEQEENEKRMTEAVDTIHTNIPERELHGFNSATNNFMDKPSSSSFERCLTTSSKTIAISKEAPRKADVVLAKFEQKEMGKGMEVLPKSCDISKKRNQTEILMPSEAPACGPPFDGFSTASRKPIAISEEAKRKANDILKKFEQEERERKLTQDEVEKRNGENDDVGPSTSAFAGFSTASKKPIIVSDASKRKADEFLKNFDKAEQEEWLQESKEFAAPNEKNRKLDNVSEEVKQKAQELLKDIEFFEEAFEEELTTIEKQSTAYTATQSFTLPKPMFYGFKTASKKSIQISEGARRHADQVLSKVENEDLPQDFLKCIQLNLNELQASHPAGSSIPKEDQVDGTSKDPHEMRQMKTDKNHLHATESSLSGLNGFKKSVQFSEEISVGSKDVFKVVDEINLANPHFARSNEIKEEFNKGTNSYPQEYEMTETLKRKLNISFTDDDLQRSPPLISPRRLSCTERTPLNRIDNAILHKTSSLPHIKSTSKSSLITRKNLLSLSKRKKMSSSNRVDDNSPGRKTPEKVQHPPLGDTNATPNLKEFFDSVSTSTPRLNRNVERTICMPSLKDSSIDTDFRQINWEDANNSGRLCRNSSFTDPNITCSEVSPSPKQRIERLKMYGEPPPISPILMVNQCRPSGLRRGRSLMKP